MDSVALCWRISSTVDLMDPSLNMNKIRWPVFMSPGFPVRLRLEICLSKSHIPWSMDWTMPWKHGPRSAFPLPRGASSSGRDFMRLDSRSRTALMVKHSAANDEAAALVAANCMPRSMRALDILAQAPMAPAMEVSNDIGSAMVANRCERDNEDDSSLHRWRGPRLHIMECSTSSAAT